jgi:pSer/pThr/pTyr-binding forkhead associated (FHA) protein
MWLLTIEDDEGLTTFHRLTRDRYTIGRAPGCDLVLAQLDVSRRHARLERGEGGFHLFDEAGRETTFLNAMPLRGGALVGDGDVAQIAGYLLRFSASVPTGLPTPPPRYVAPARLRALAGPLAGDEFVFPRDETVTIGTSDDCTLRVLNRRVSVVHALFLPLPGGRHEIVDKSHNGLLFVNGRPVPGRQVLEGGDVINVGHAAIFRYLEPSQRPHPRFDAVWAEGALALAVPPAPASAPGPRADLVSAPTAVDAGAPTTRAEGETTSASRVESAGPLALPAPVSPPASFERLCRATMGRAVSSNGAGAERAVVAPPPSSGRSLVAFEAPVGEAAQALRGGVSDLDDHREAKAGRPDHDQGADDASPGGAIVREPPRRAWSVLLVAAAAALVAVGATVGLRAPRGPGARAWPSARVEDERPAGAAMTTLALAPPAAVVTSPEPVVSSMGALPGAAVSAGATSEPGAAGATSETGAAGATTEAKANEGATAPRGSRRARLLARARSGRAAASELRDLFSLCSEAGDAGCMAEARTFLLRAPRRP